MKNLYEVIRRPLITEKSTALKETQRTLVLRGASRRHQARDQEGGGDALRRKVQDVRVANVHGKVKRQGRYQGQRPDWKKAYVVLKKGEKMIEFFEQA